ncbi:hypothetical protein Tco_0770142 [Tanacetum coccineum]|uniref:Uncharacterized protein n=1 Tax=Tanacetum coccineum TaxID=301880 RepID=A0ABQ4ZD95_9ASTR
MEDSWKSMDLNKFVVKDDMIDCVLNKYGSKWQVHDAIADDILDDLLKREWEKHQRVKYDKRKATKIKILELLEQRIEKVGKHLNKEKQIMDINKEKENGDGKSCVVGLSFIMIIFDWEYEVYAWGCELTCLLPAATTVGIPVIICRISKNLLDRVSQLR